MLARPVKVRTEFFRVPGLQGPQKDTLGYFLVKHVSSAFLLGLEAAFGSPVVI